jgi:Family of unknown function (DUF6263)
MRLTCKLLAVLAALSLAGAAQAQSTLRYQYKKGDKLDYVIDQDQKMAMKVAGMDIDMKMSMVMDMNLNTLDVDQEGNAKIKVTLSRVKMTMDGPMGKVEIDSKDNNEADDPIGKILGQVVKSIAGMEMTYTADPMGDMKNFKVSENTVKKLKGLPGLDKLGEMFTPDNFKSMVANNMVLPKDEVEKGKSWTQKTDAKLPFGKVTGETKYTYEGTIEKNGKTLAKIAVKPDVKIESDPDAQFQIKIKDSKSKGYVLFDNTAGRVAETITESTMQMELEVAGMTIDQNITQNTTMRLKGGKKAPSPGENK